MTTMMNNKQHHPAGGRTVLQGARIFPVAFFVAAGMVK
jgi:hypothetical protein